MTAKVMASVTFTAFMALKVLTRSQDMTEPECSKHRFDSAFTPGVSCEDIYNENEQTHDKPGYYWILDGPALVYCGMNYTGSSCAGRNLRQQRISHSSEVGLLSYR